MYKDMYEYDLYFLNYQPIDLLLYTLVVFELLSDHWSRYM